MPDHDPAMPTDRRWSDADRELVAQAIRDSNAPEAWFENPQLVPAHHFAAAVLDALTADGWRPPPPEPDGVHWRVGGSVGCTIYNPYGDLAGMMRTPEAAAAVVDVLNAHAEGDSDAD